MGKQEKIVLIGDEKYNRNIGKNETSKIKILGK
jgi:hypothetical protein